MPPKTTRGVGEAQRKRVREAEAAAAAEARERNRDLLSLLEGRLRRRVTDDELQEVRQVLDRCAKRLLEFRDALVQWNPNDPLTPLPVGPTNSDCPASILHQELSFYSELKVVDAASRKPDARLAWAMLRCLFSSQRFTLKEFGALNGVKDAGSATFLTCGRAFIGAGAVDTMRNRFVGPAGATFKPLDWIPKPKGGVVTLYSGPSGSGKTMNACLLGLGLHQSKAAADNCFLIYVVPGAEQRELVVQLESEMATGLKQLGAAPPADAVAELKGRRNARASNLVLMLAAGATKSPSGSELLPPLAGGYALTVVLDEMGAYRQFTRGICANQGEIRTELAKRYGVAAVNVFLVVVGSGIDGTATSPPGSLPESYMFHTCGVEKESNGETLLSTLFASSTVAPEVQHIVMEITKSTTDQGRTVSWLASNARCAALLTEDLTTAFQSRVATLLNNSSPLQLRKTLEKVLYATVVKVVTQFMALNGLSSLSTNNANIEVLRAIAIAARPRWNTERLDRRTWELTGKYGLLTDNAKLMTLEAATRDGRVKLEQNAEFQDQRYLTLDPDQRRYSIQGAHVAMALLHFGAITQPLTWEGAELLLRDYAALCSLISRYCDYFERVPDDDNSSLLFPAGGWRPRLMPANDDSSRSVKERNYWALRSILHQEADVTLCAADPFRQHVAGTEICKAALRNALVHDEKGTEPPMNPTNALCWTLLDFRKKIVNDKAAIVFVNGPCAPFADVIVLSLNKVVLLQVKQFSDDKKSVDTEGELDKMDEPELNPLLQELCASDPTQAQNTAIYRVIVSTDAVSNEAVPAAVEGQVRAFHFHTNDSQGAHQASLFFPLLARWYQPLPGFQRALYLGNTT